MGARAVRAGFRIVALALGLVAIAPACSSFGGDGGSPATDAGTPDAIAEDGAVPQDGSTPATWQVGCGADTCVGPETFCCFPPDGPEPPPPFCTSKAGDCSGDSVAIYCDGPSDCPSSTVCCMTVRDLYRIGSATCRKSCGEGDASTTDLRLCNPVTAVAQNECPKGDCVELLEAKEKIAGGTGIQIKSALYACNAN